MFLRSFARLLRAALSLYSPPKPEIERAPAEELLKLLSARAFALEIVRGYNSGEAHQDDWR